MESNGWIKLHRSILRWEWWDDRNVRDLFLYCLLAANHEDVAWHGEVVPRGSFVTSLAKLAKSAGLTVKETRRAIEKLESTKELGTQRTNQYSIITINKYEKYQLCKEDKGQAKGKQRANKGHADGQTKGNKQEIEEYNNISLTQDACACIYNNNNGSLVANIENLYQEYRELIAQPMSENSISFQRRFKKSPSELSGYLDDFQNELRAEGTQPTRTRSDYRRYFLNYLSRRIEKEQRQQQTTIKTNGTTGQYKTDAERRLHNVGNFDDSQPLADF